MSNMLDWAEREVAIACKKENPKRNIFSENLSPSVQADILYYVENRIIKN